MKPKPIYPKSQDIRIIKFMEDNKVSVKSIKEDVKKLEKEISHHEQFRRKQQKFINQILKEQKNCTLLKASRQTACQNTSPKLRRSGRPEATKEAKK